MFDKDKVKEELQEMYASNPMKDTYDWDAIINSYTVIRGFYVFRVDDDAYFFTDNELMDCCPCYYSILGGA